MKQELVKLVHRGLNSARAKEGEFFPGLQLQLEMQLRLLLEQDQRLLRKLQEQGPASEAISYIVKKCSGKFCCISCLLILGVAVSLSQ